MDYTNEELKMINKMTDDLILWLFTTNEKRYAINKTIKEAYDKGKEVVANS